MTQSGRVETDAIGIVSEFTLYRRHSSSIGRKVTGLQNWHARHSTMVRPAFDTMEWGITMAKASQPYSALVAHHSILHFKERIQRLYEQQKRVREGALLLGKYMARWLRWSRGGRAGVAITLQDVADDGLVVPLVHLRAMQGL
jgi:hypothetical protein